MTVDESKSLPQCREPHRTAPVMKTNFEIGHHKGDIPKKVVIPIVSLPTERRVFTVFVRVKSD
jgi:hypothetical protein